MFIFLIVLADVPATSDVGVGFAWLIFVTVALLYGTDAFRNITKVVAAKPVTPPDNIA